MSVFLWPPTVTSNSQINSYGYFYGDANGDLTNDLVFTGPLYTPSTDKYRACDSNYYAGNHIVAAFCNLYPNNGFMTSGSSTTGTISAGLTTTDGIAVLGGYDNIGEDWRHGVQTDIDNSEWAWGTVQTTGSVVKGMLYHNGSYRYANTATLTLHGARGAVKINANDYFCFSWNGTNTRYQKLSNASGGSGTFGSITNIFNSGEQLYYMLYAGENYYYAITHTGSFVGIRGVDFSTGSPVVTGFLGSSGASPFTGTPARGGCHRYITLGGNRVLAFKCQTATILITFTSGTKGSPTISRVSDGISSDGYTVEADPADTTKAYLVTYAFSLGSPTPGTLYVKGQYIDLTNTGAGYSSQITLGTVYNPDEVGILRSHGVSSAQNGETTRSIAVAGVSQSFGDAYGFALTMQFWHTPILFELGVDVTSTYTSVSATVTSTKPRGVDIVSGYTSVGVGVAISGSHADDFRWKLEVTTEKTSGVVVTSGYTSVTVGAAILTLVDGETLTQNWTNTGYTFMDDFMVYLNNDRAAIGRPPIKTFGKDGLFLDRKDIATYHATQEARLRIFAHDDTGYYPGYQTILQRQDNCPATYGAENLQVVADYYLTTRTDLGFPSAFTLWQNWHNSAGHYANMTFNWGADNSKVYSMLGIAEGWSPAALGSTYEPWLWTYAANNFVVLETVMFETSIDQYWDNSGALIATMDQTWSNDAYTHVAGRYEAPYSIRVSKQNELQWGARTARQLDAPWGYGVLVQMIHPYEPTAAAPKVQMESSYDIKNTTSVKQQNSSPFALTVAAQSEAPYVGNVKVFTQYEAPFSIFNTQPVSLWHEARYGLSVSGQAEHPYVGTEALKASYEAPYAIKNTTSVVAQCSSPFGLSVSAQSEAPYTGTDVIRQQYEAPFAIKNTTSVQQQNSALYGMVVSAQSESPYTGTDVVRVQYEAPFAIKSTTTVLQQLDARYGLSVGSQSEAPYTGTALVHQQYEAPYEVKSTTTVRQQYEAPFGLTVAMWHEAPYVGTVFIKAQDEASYDLKFGTEVLVQHEARYGHNVTAQYEAPYAGTVTSPAQFEAQWSVSNTTPVHQQNELRYGGTISKQNEASWSLAKSVQAQHEARYGDIVVVRTQEQMDYALLGVNPIKVSHAGYWNLLDYVSTIVNDNAVKLILPDGSIIVVDDGVIESSENDIGYNFECAITDLSVFKNIHEDDPIVVDFCGEIYDFFVTSKSMTRDGPTGISFRLSATNAVVRTGSPYATGTTFVQEGDALASDLVDALVEINFTYEIVDWTILSGRLQAAGATSLEAIQQIAEAAGGVVDGDIDGTMRIRYPYPVPMNALDPVTPDQVYSDDYDNLSVTVSTQYRDGANKFRIREGDVSYNDSLVWLPDEKQTLPNLQTGLVKAYLSPYRQSAQIVHLGNAQVFTLGDETTEELEELVEFNEGAGNTSRPIHQLVSFTWYTADMGTPSYTPFSTIFNVGTTVNNGYGIAKVVYNTKYLTARVAGVPATVESGKVGPASSYGYFILEDSNA